MSLLGADDLAYMRATQEEAHPTPATLRPRIVTRTPTGGTATTWGTGEPVTVRVSTAPDELPQPLAARFGTATPHKISLSVGHDVRDGDRLEVSPTETYEVVTDGDPDAWATAQVIYARRLTYPVRGS